MRNLLNKRLGISLSPLEWKIWIIGIFFFLTLRLWNLTILPIFTDEAIYIRWSEIAMHADFSRAIIASPADATPESKVTHIPVVNTYLDNYKFNLARNDLFVPLSDGKQPLFMWLATIPMIFSNDHLWAGRLPSVLSGLGSFIGIWLLTYQLFKNKKIAYIASFVYLVLPFTFLYDRMMLADSMLAMWGIWSLYLSLRLLESPTLKKSILLGIVFGLGLLTKSPAIFYIAWAPATLLLFKNSRAGEVLHLQDFLFWNWPIAEKKKLLKWILFWLLSIVIGQAIQSILRLSSLYHMIARKNLEFVLTTDQFLAHPFEMLYGNLVGTSTWMINYLGSALAICLAIAVLRGLLKLDKKIILLIVITLAPWIASASFAKVLYPRYLLFYTPPIIVLIAYGIYTVNQFLRKLLSSNPRSVRIGVLSLLNALIFAFPVYFTATLLFNPPAAPLPLQDKEQYVVGWPSGYGVEEVYQYLRKELDKNGKIAIGTEGTFGLMPFALQIKFYDQIYNTNNRDKHVFIEGYWPFINVPQRMVEYAVDRPTYFLVYQNENEIPKGYPLELVLSIEKPGGKTRMRLYKVTPVSQYLPEGAVIK